MMKSKVFVIAVLTLVAVCIVAVVFVNRANQPQDSGAFLAKLFGTPSCTVEFKPVPPQALPQPSPGGRPWVLAYLAEGYKETSLFPWHVDRIRNTLQADILFKDYVTWFEHVRVPLVSCQDGVTAPSAPVASALRLEANYKYSQCYYNLTKTFSERVGQAAQGVANLRSIVVVPNRDGSLQACTFGDLVILPANARMEVIAHEFGHLVGGVFDEIGGSASCPDVVKGPNCASKYSGASWLPGIKGCGGFSNLFRPGDQCRMGNQLTNWNRLCPYCTSTLIQALKIHNQQAENPQLEYYQLILRLYQEYGKWQAETVGLNRFSGSPEEELPIRGELVVALKSALGTVKCVSSPPSPGRPGRLQGAVGVAGAEVTDGLITIMRCPVSAFPDGPPKPFGKVMELYTRKFKPGTTGTISTAAFVRWMSDPDGPMLPP